MEHPDRDFHPPVWVEHTKKPGLKGAEAGFPKIMPEQDSADASKTPGK